MRAERVRRVYARSEIGQRANSLVHDRQGLVPMCDAAPALTRAANIQARFLRSLHHHFKAALLAAMSRTERPSICGIDCAEYRSLAAALEQPPGTGLVY